MTIDWPDPLGEMPEAVQNWKDRNPDRYYCESVESVHTDADAALTALVDRLLFKTGEATGATLRAERAEADLRFERGLKDAAIKRFETVEAENTRLLQAHDRMGVGLFKAEAEVEKLRWMLDEAYLTMTDGPSSWGRDEWLADLARRWEEHND